MMVARLIASSFVVFMACSSGTPLSGAASSTTGGTDNCEGGVPASTGGATLASGGYLQLEGGTSSGSGGTAQAAGGVLLTSGGMQPAIGGAPLASGGASQATGGSSGVGGRSASGGGASSVVGGASASSQSTSTGAAGATAGDSGREPQWTDLTPGRNRIGPQTLPRQLFASEVQLGAYWETPSGDVLTTFRTSITQPTPGVAIDDYNYTMQTVVNDAIQPVPNLSMETCRYQDPPYGSCSVGPDPDGPSLLSVVTDDGKILVAKNKVASSMAHPIVQQLDPATGTLSTFIDFSDMQMSAATYSPTLNLRLLGDGSIALAMALPTKNGPAQTAVFDTAGTRVGMRTGFAFGDRWQRFAVLLGQPSGSGSQRFDWWDPRTDTSAFGFELPTPDSTTSLRTSVTKAGDVILPAFIESDRLVHVDQDGNVVEDRSLWSWGFLGPMLDGGYLAYEPDTTQDSALNYVLRMYDRTGSSRVIYDDPSLLQDSQWPTLVGGRNYPVLDSMHNTALIDDAGNAYVDFVLQTGGNSTTETYVVAFAADGHKLWGLNLKSWDNGVCHTRQVLSNRRLIVSCSGRYVRRFLILGE